MLLFFFKQRTAYEMRISDWSSDVCSSDLRAGIPERPDLAIEIRQAVGHGAVDRDNAVAALETGGFRRALRGHPIDQEPALGILGIDPKPRFEIGRASCRERVCQYV